MGAPAAVITIPPNGHISRFVSELIPSWQAGATGVIQLASSQVIAALSLKSLTNERGDFLLTTIPVAVSNVDGPMPIVFAQIAQSGGYSTEVILIGNGLTSTATIVNFYDSTGQPLQVGPNN